MPIKLSKYQIVKTSNSPLSNCNGLKQYLCTVMLKALFILPIRIYQYVVSPWLPNACRHTPTCSQYAIESIKEWGVLKGTWLGAKRISKCHPWGTSGYDPVPKKTPIQ